VEARVGEAGLHGLVNNAGIAVAGPFEFVPVEDFDRQLQVNVIGQVRVTQAFLPLLRQARGRLCFMGSTGGFFSAPFMAPYSASKYCLEAFTDALRVELAPWGIRISVVQPGAIKTPIWDKARRDGDAMLKKLPADAERLYGSRIRALLKMVDITERRAVPPEEVAKCVLHAIHAPRPRVRYRVGWDAFAQYVVNHLPYRWRDKLVEKGMGV
jgi:NAD(P)-dependent dehydrogenase (short-subunit alcohol dehydrogenase family)